MSNQSCLLKSYIFLTLLFCSTQSQASWNAQHWQVLRQYPNRFEDPFAATNWAAARIQFMRPSEKWKGKRFFSRSNYYKKPLGYVVFENGNADFSKKSERCMFFVSGIFSNPTTSRSINYVRSYLELGYRVIFLPNPWGSEIIQAEAKIPLGDIQYEGLALYEIAKQSAQTHCQKNDRFPVELVGESYGTLLSSVMLSKDKERLFDGNVFLISPIFNLYDSFRLLDAHLDFAVPRFFDNPFWQLLMRAVPQLLAETDRAFSPEERVVAKTMTLHGFHSNLTKSIEAFDKLNLYNRVPRDFLAKRDWERNFRFKTYVDTYAPHLREKYKNGYGRLSYWLEKSDSWKERRVLMLTTQNDFLNTAESRDQFQGSHLATLPSGGHSGFLAHFDWFERLAAKIWQLNH